MIYHYIISPFFGLFAVVLVFACSELLHRSYATCVAEGVCKVMQKFVLYRVSLKFEAVNLRFGYVCTYDVVTVGCQIVDILGRIL